MRNSEQIKAEILDKFGFFPPFFSPGLQNPQVLENLWQQTLSAYVGNPLSALFKEKLSAYLSRFCAVPYCMICHSCSLHDLGMQAREVLELLESPPPDEMDVDEHLRVLAAQPSQLPVVAEWNSVVQESLIYCSTFIFLEGKQADYCRTELRRLLGHVNYQHLVAIISYVKTCHSWMEAHPEVAYGYEADKRVLDNLGALLEDEPGLADFFKHYRERVSLERQSWAQKLAQIAERKRHEEALRQSEQRFRATFAQAAVGIAHVGMDGHWLLVNQKLCNILAYTDEELRALTFQDITHPEDLDVDGEYVAQILANEIQTYSQEKRYIRKDGFHVWINLTVSLVRELSSVISPWSFANDKGQKTQDKEQPKYFIFVVEDISDRKRAETQINQLNADLQRRAVQLEVVNKELEAFSYSLSHDLRGPLRRIDGFSQMLLEDCINQLDEQGKKYIERIRAATGRMGQLIEDMLSLARVSKSEMRRETFDLSALVQTIAQDLQNTEPERQVEFAIAPNIFAYADAKLLQIALENLIGNAWKYTAKHQRARIEFGVTQLSALKIQDKGVSLHSSELIHPSFFTVHRSSLSTEPVYFLRDDGVGFDMGDASKLFKAFCRLHDNTEFEGTGVGLATVQRIIHRHGGRIWAQAAVDKGATFYFTL